MTEANVGTVQASRGAQSPRRGARPLPGMAVPTDSPYGLHVLIPTGYRCLGFGRL